MGKRDSSQLIQTVPLVQIALLLGNVTFLRDAVKTYPNQNVPKK